MGCRTEMNTAWLNQQDFNKNFLSDHVKRHIKDVMFDKERAKMPQAQERIAVLREADEFDATAREMKKQVDELKRIYEDAQAQYLEQKQEANKRRDVNYTPERPRVFTYPCGVGDCRGFVDEDYKCGVCSTFTCPDCFQPIGMSKEGGAHACDPDMVASAKAIKESSRGCPGCGERISKIDGCDQMWCPSCHVAFSWKTGRVDYGRIHNPHYYQWMRGNAPDGVIRREPGDQVRQDARLVTVLQTIQSKYFPVRSYSLNAVRMIELITSVTRAKKHIARNILTTLNTITNSASNANIANNERALFMLNIISEKRFRQRLADKVDVMWYYTVLRDAYQEFVDKLNDISHAFVVEHDSKPMLESEFKRTVCNVTQLYITTMQLSIELTNKVVEQYRIITSVITAKDIKSSIVVVVPGYDKVGCVSARFIACSNWSMTAADQGPGPHKWPCILTGAVITQRTWKRPKYENYFELHNDWNGANIARFATMFQEKSNEDEWVSFMDADWIATLES